MNIKSVYKYQVSGFVQLWSIYFIVMIALEVLTLILTRLIGGEANGTFSGYEAASVMAGFIAGWACFKDGFHMLVQNSVSRKRMFISRMLVILSNGFVFTLMHLVFQYSFDLFSLGNHKMVSSATLQTTYPVFYMNLGGFGILLSSILFWACIIIMATTLGYFMGTLYYRLEKGARLAISIGVPVILFFIGPLLDLFLLQGNLNNTISWILGSIFGIRNQNPYIGMVSAIVITVVIGGLSYLLLLKAQLKKQ